MDLTPEEEEAARQRARREQIVEPPPVDPVLASLRAPAGPVSPLDRAVIQDRIDNQPPATPAPDPDGLTAEQRARIEGIKSKMSAPDEGDADSAATPKSSPGPDPLAALNDAVAPRTSAAAATADLAKQVGPDVTTTRQVQTKEEKAALGRLDAGNVDQKKTAGEAKDLAMKQAGDIHAADVAEFNAASAVEADARERQKRADAAFQKADAYLTQKRADFEKTSKIHDLFDGKDAAAASANLWAGIGAFGAALTGGENQALRVIQHAQDNHLQKEKARVQTELDKLNMSREERDHAEQRADIELKNRQIAANNVLIKERAARLSSRGADEARIKGDTIIQGLSQQNDMLHLDNAKSLRTTVQSSNANQNQLKLAALMQAQPSSDKPIEKADHTERQADHFTNIGVTAYKQLKSLPGYDAHDLKLIAQNDAMLDDTLKQTAPEKFAAVFAAVRGTLVNKLHNKSRLAAETTFVNSTIRPESGAAIGANEYRNRSIETRKAIGDDAKALAQKDSTMLGYLAGNAVQSFRPGYWNQQLHAAGGSTERMTNVEKAMLAKEIQTNGPRAAEARRLLAAAGGTQ